MNLFNYIFNLIERHNIIFAILASLLIPCSPIVCQFTFLELFFVLLVHPNS